MGRKSLIFLLGCLALGCSAHADQPEPDFQTVRPETTVTAPAQPVQALPQPSEHTPKLFSLGRSVGSSYFYLIDLSEKVNTKPFVELQKEYSTAFQNLNVIDIILDDLNILGKSRQDLNKLRINFYNALKNQDLSETNIAFVRDMFVVFYENLAQDVKAKFDYQGSWFLSMGFYTSFQLESLNSPAQEKVLLSGFSSILQARPVLLPESIQTSLLAINNLDKVSITQSELTCLENNLVKVTEYFTNYPETRPLFSEVKDLIGVWQGILVNPENEKRDIRLIINEDLSAAIDIPGIAGGMKVSDVRIINNYFTFMFKPFGTEKLYLRFDARLTDNVFTGEITDVLGYKGYWVLAKIDENRKLSEENLDTMVSYIGWIEEKLQQQSVCPIKEISCRTHSENKEIGCVLPPIDETSNAAEELNETFLPELEAEKLPILEEIPEKSIAEINEFQEKPEKKGLWGRLAGGFKWFINLVKKPF